MSSEVAARLQSVLDGPHGRMAVVFAQLDVAGQAQGVHAFLVPIRDEHGQVAHGVDIEDCGEKMGLQGVDSGRLRFSAARIPRDALLDRYGTVTEDGRYESPISSPGARFFTMIGALVEGRICIAGASLAVARSALTIAVRWGERRRQFGTGLEMDTPLMDYLTHQRRLLPAVASSYALQAAHDHLTRCYVDVLADAGGPGQRAVEALAAGLKALSSWHMVEAVQQSRECCGGKGYLAENRFAARGEVELRSSDWQASALRFREERVVDALARRLRSLVQDGTDPLRALSLCQDHALAAATAHLERVVHEQFALRVKESGLPLLADVASLSSLWALQRDRAWWLEHGFLTPDDSKSLQKEVNVLCRELRPHALDLVDGFAIPDEPLGAPIATAPQAGGAGTD